MNYEKWRELASEYIEGTLPSDRVAEIRAFLASSPEARADEQALRGITSELKAFPEEDPPLYFAENIISRIEREEAAKKSAWWRMPNLGRLAVGSLLTGGAIAAFVFSAFLPKDNQVSKANVIVPIVPTSSPVKNAPIPFLKLARPIENVNSLDFPLTLENGAHGSVVATINGNTEPTGLSFDEKTPSQTLRVPIATGSELVTVHLHWISGGALGDKWIAVPTNQQAQADTERRLSFSQGDQPLTEAVAETARRYGQTLILSDVNAALRVNLDARQETLEQMLQRNFGGSMTVTKSPEGFVISPKSVR
jgi:hypothetical protein